MRRIILVTIFIVSTIIGFAQVGIGTNTPNASSVLDLTSTNKAFLPPRMTSSQRDSIVNPIAGMVIFNTTTTCVEIYRGTGWFNVCTGTTSVSGGNTVDGDTSSNQVAQSNLVAYWPFDGNNTESISATAGANISGAASPTYSSARIGQGINFSNGGLIYPPIPALDSINKLQRYTVSMWVNISSPASAEVSLFGVNGDWYNDLWNLVSVGIHPAPAPPAYGGDTLSLGAELTQIDGTGVHTNDSTILTPRTTPAQYFSGAGKWSLITETYDDATDSVHIYGNGVLYTAKKIYILPDISTGETFTLNPNFGFTPPTYPYAHNQVTFGTFMFLDDFGASNPYVTYTATYPHVLPPYGNAPAAATKTPWSHGMTGSLDDVRVFNRVLTAQEISDLYQLGLLGK